MSLPRRWYVAPAVLLATGLIGAPGALAQVPDISATVTGPTPNPGTPGTSSAFSVEFTVTADLGLIQVRISLQGANGQGALSIDTANTTPELTNCVTAPTPGGTDVTCDWDAQITDGPQTLAVNVDIDSQASWFNVWNLEVVVFQGSLSQTLANTDLTIGPPTGSVTLSGSVITTGGAPVAGACIFLLAGPGVFQAIADAQGNWSASGLPDDYAFAVAVTPPFSGSQGPCSSDTGPPPVPPPGELQPEFYDNIWIDLSDPELVGGQTNPYAYATARGATSFSATATGLQTCLTTTPSDVVPRPACFQEPTTTTAPPTTQPAPSTTAARRGGSTTGIAATGWTGTLGLTGFLLMVAGAALLVTTRRRRPTP